MLTGSKQDMRWIGLCLLQMVECLGAAVVERSDKQMKQQQSRIHIVQLTLRKPELTTNPPPHPRLNEIFLKHTLELLHVYVVSYIFPLQEATRSNTIQS